jgi:hypothetical protein
MKLNNLESRVRYRIKRNKGSVFVLSDFQDLSGRDQVGRALKQLILKQELLKIGYGLYAKAKISALSGNVVPVKPLPNLGKEALNKLGVTVVPSSARRNYLIGQSTQVPTGRVLGVRDTRITRKIGYDGKYIALEYASR